MCKPSSKQRTDNPEACISIFHKIPDPTFMRILILVPVSKDQDNFYQDFQSSPFTATIHWTWDPKTGLIQTLTARWSPSWQFRWKTNLKCLSAPKTLIQRRAARSIADFLKKTIYITEQKKTRDDFRSKDFNTISLKLMDFNHTLVRWGRCLLWPALRSSPGEKA